MHCREYAAQLRDAHAELTAKGASVVAVGTGNPMFAQDFIEQMKIPFLVLIDGDGAAAKAASLKSMKPWSIFNPALWLKSFHTMKSGFKQTKPGARPMQLGAQFVVAHGGKVVFEHLEDDPSDHAPVAQLLAAL